MSFPEALLMAAGIVAAACIAVVALVAWVDFAAKLDVSEPGRASAAIAMLPVLIALTAGIALALYKGGLRL